MSNMSYVRFQNTYADLKDCYINGMDDNDLSDSEENYRKILVKLCKDIADDYGYILEED